MPDLRQTRKNIKTALAVLLGVDVVAVAVLFSPLVGSTDSRRQELNQLRTELQTKTHQVEPLKNLDKKVITANRQITDFYKKRFPAQDSQIPTEFGKLAVANGVTIEQAKYKVRMKRQAGCIRSNWKRTSQAITFRWRSLSMRWNAMTCFSSSAASRWRGEQKGPIKLQMKLETYLKAGA